MLAINIESFSYKNNIVKKKKRKNMSMLGMLTINIKVFLRKKKTKRVNIHVNNIKIFLKQKKTRSSNIDVNNIESKNKIYKRSISLEN